MKRRLLFMFVCSLLSSMVLAGCNNDNNDQNPPPSVNTNYNNDRDMAPTNTKYDVTPNDGNDVINNDDNFSPAEDKNTDTDKDPMKDSNTKNEEIIEDDIDRNDRDNKDE